MVGWPPCATAVTALGLLRRADCKALVAGRRVTGFFDEEEAAFGKAWSRECPRRLDTQPLQLDIQLGRHGTLALPAPVLVLLLALADLRQRLFERPACSVGQVSLEDGALGISSPGVTSLADAGEDFVEGESSAGAGRGMSILRRLLEQHGSRLGVQHDAGCARIIVG